jgi:phosphoribosylformylglycinamidine cyclo-ligase
LIDGHGIVVGDRLIGIPSSGLHTNGYSLARRIVFDRLGLGIRDRVPELGATVGDVLLAPHRSYLSTMRPLLRNRAIKGMAHITGGGITDNLPRILPRGLEAIVRVGSWSVPPLFTWLRTAGAVPEDDMRRTFNMGIGLIVAVAESDAERVLVDLQTRGERDARVIGEVVGAASADAEPRVRYVTG